jgi:hypothetical protein
VNVLASKGARSWCKNKINIVDDMTFRGRCAGKTTSGIPLPRENDPLSRNVDAISAELEATLRPDYQINDNSIVASVIQRKNRVVPF